jgi:hypothetical protein
MHNDDKMMVVLFMHVEANATAERQQQLMMLANLLHLCRHLLSISAPTRGGSRVGKAPNKDRHRQDGSLLLDSDYFADNTTHKSKDLRPRFRMNKNLFMKIIFGITEY